MAYSGFLIKVGNYTLKEKYINCKTYNVTRNVMDVDSYRDSNGVLHRMALEHVPVKVEFETPPLLTNGQMAELFENIRVNYIIPGERKALVTLYVPETDSYITQNMYMPDLTFTISKILSGVIYYEPLRIAFIGY